MIKLTDIESVVLKRLHNRVKKVKPMGNEIITEKYITVIIEFCSSWSFPVIFSDYSPTDISSACKSLVEKQLLKEIEGSDGLPCFVPITELNYVELTYKTFSKNKIK